MEEAPVYKVILIGDSSVGKTCLFNKYTKGQIPKVLEATTSQDFKSKPITLPDGKIVKAQIWDTAGQERYRSIMSQNYRKAVGALLVFDITQPSTFASVKKWSEDVKMHAEPDIIFYLIGNKLDLEKNRLVQSSQAEQFAKENGFIYVETSAVTGTGITEAFEALLNKIHEQRKTSANKGGSSQAGASGQRISAQQQQQNQNEGGCKC